MTPDFDCCAQKAARTRSPLISPEVLAVVRAAGYLVIDPDDTATLRHVGNAVVHPQEYVSRAPFEPGSPWPESKTTWRRRAVIAALTKQAAAGVCLCCKRSFVDVARHMANQHPDFVAEHANG